MKSQRTTAAPSNRITGRRLQDIRKKHFERNPLCVECTRQGRITLATELDHIVALDNGGPDFDKDNGTNRQGLCSSCHEIKTRKDMGYRPRLAISMDGWPEQA
jgi:5-methylcytosine-specific restriction protein A